MGAAQKILVGIATTITLSVTVVATEFATNVFTKSCDPRNLWTYAQFKSFESDFDYRDQESFKEVSKFVRCNGCGYLVARPQTNLRGQVYYSYRYYKFVDNLPETDIRNITNWDAVRKYMKVEKERVQAAKSGTVYNVHNT